ncbi:hypothetical protein PENSPDRAFT_757448 [Peniophora sp. CONT]|nr:hypothetical protein PENSPDRAFT_757448 [Peniophora sp. CONT]
MPVASPSKSIAATRGRTVPATRKPASTATKATLDKAADQLADALATSLTTKPPPKTARAATTTMARKTARAPLPTTFKQSAPPPSPSAEPKRSTAGAMRAANAASQALTRVAWIFYRQSQDINRFLQSNDSVSRTNYIRIIALASIDVLLGLPIGIISIALAVKQALAFDNLPFYPGWTHDHTEWAPVGFLYADLITGGTFGLVQGYFVQWTSPVLAFAIFGLFGVISEARVSYWRVICTVGGWFGWRPTVRKAHSSLKDTELGDRPRDASIDIEIGSRSPSFVNPNVRAQELSAASEGEHATHEVENDSDMEIREERKVGVGDAECVNPLSLLQTSKLILNAE